MRKLATAAVSFSAAVFLSQYLLPASWLVWCGCCFAAASFIGLCFKANTRLRLILVFIGLSAGFLWCLFYASMFYGSAKEFDGKTQTVSATVMNAPEATDYGSKVLVSVQRKGTPGIKTQLYIYGAAADIRPGYTIEFTARFRLADTIYGEKTEAFLARGIFLLASNEGNVTVKDASEPALFFPVRLAGRLAQMITTIFPKDTAAFMQALLLGDTSGVYKDKALSGALSSTGTSHIISVSGMNIAFLMGFISLFIRKKRLLTAIGIPVIVLFMSVVGFSPPVVRAGVMQIFMLSAPLFKRESDAVTSLTAALMLILLINPYAAGSAGLQLSFSATLGILLFTEKIYNTFDEPFRKRKMYENRIVKASARFIIASLATTIGALSFSIPLIALHFGTVSLIAPLTNLLIIWAVTLAFCIGIAAVILGFIFAPVGSAAAFIAALPADYVIAAIKFFSRVPFASVYTANPAVVIWLIYVYLLLITVLALRVKLRQLLSPACVSVVSLCLILLMTSFFSDRQGLSVAALDVGQGQAIVITSGKYTAVVDCGSSSGKDAGDSVTKYLQSRGRVSIDLLILTHYHADHANGIIELLERNRVLSVAIPDPSIEDGTLPQEILELSAKKGIKIIRVTDNLQVSFNNEETTLTLYAPIGGSSENERGLSVLCSEDGFDALITGDMNAEIEQTLVTTAHLPDIELLVVGHHGSRNSTSDALLDAVVPETAVISVGYNTYGHPSPVTLQKLADAGISVYRTDEQGNVTVNGW